MKLALASLLTLIPTFILAESLTLDKDKVEGYISYIEDNSDLVYNGESLPSFVLKEPEDLLRTLFGDSYDPNAKDTAWPDVQAIYNHNSREIYLKNTFQWSDHNQSHIIVHELVHYMQDINGVLSDIPACSEKLAYDIQHKWMDETGVEATRSNDLFLVMIYSRCRNPHRR